MILLDHAIQCFHRSIFDTILLRLRQFPFFLPLSAFCLVFSSQQSLRKFPLSPVSGQHAVYLGCICLSPSISERLNIGQEFIDVYFCCVHRHISTTGHNAERRNQSTSARRKQEGPIARSESRAYEDVRQNAWVPDEKKCRTSLE